MSNEKSNEKAAASGGMTLLSDLKSGFMVFLIALPLCLGIAAASGCPPIAGVYTAIAGGVIATFLSNSQLTIKGPAAGLIVIVVGCVTEFSLMFQEKGMSLEEANLAGYRMALAVCVVSGILQIIFGALKGGVLGDFFPSSAVHGLLASIGVIIIAKQIPVALGIAGSDLVDASGHQYAEPLFLILNLPRLVIAHFDPTISAIGVVGLLIMFGMPAMSQKLVKVVPAQLVTLIVTVPLAIFVLGVPHPEVKMFGQVLLPGNAATPAAPATQPQEPTPSATGAPITNPDALKTKEATAEKHQAEAKPAGTEQKPKSKYKPLVSVPNDVPDQLSKTATDITKGMLLPNFEALQTSTGWKWIALFMIIGSLESLLSAKAVDMLDPQRRKTDLNRDLLAVGVANTAVAFFGGIPMIAEIVRSRANVDNGGQTKYANFFHGVFLLLAVVSIPMLLNLIPMAALAAMLIFTGFRLAHPREFAHVYHLGREQLVVFVSTILGVLATDLLIGIFIGIGVKLLIHFINGVPLKSLFMPFLTIEPYDENTFVIKAAQSAVFSNWLLFRKQIYTYGMLQDKNIILDLSETQLVDHTVMEKLEEVQHDFEAKGLRLHIRGLEKHISVSGHPTSARIRGKVQASGQH
jgi:MFS superfamily sulfate permease-like transporter